MTEQELERVLKTLVATAEVMGHELKPTAAMVMAEDLSEYPFEAVMSALNRVRKETSGRLTLKAIIDILAPGGGWVSANEAWALALPALDEAATIVWTPEIAKAWQVAKPILDAGDKIGARMAFIPAYERLVEQSRQAGRQPHFEVSAGWDPNMREAAIQKAVTAGLLPPPKPEPMIALPPPEMDKQFMILPERGEVRDRREALAAKMREWAQSMRTDNEQDLLERARRREEERQQFEARKAEVVAQALAMDEERKQEDPS